MQPNIYCMPTKVFLYAYNFWITYATFIKFMSSYSKVSIRHWMKTFLVQSCELSIPIPKTERYWGKCLQNCRASSIFYYVESNVKNKTVKTSSFFSWFAILRSVKTILEQQKTAGYNNLPLFEMIILLSITCNAYSVQVNILKQIWKVLLLSDCLSTIKLP